MEYKVLFEVKKVWYQILENMCVEDKTISIISHFALFLSFYRGSANLSQVIF
jgi:hypothetical protein